MDNDLKVQYDIKLGFAPTRRDVFSRDDALKYKRLVEEKLKSWNVDLVNLDWLNDEGLLYSDGDVSRVVEVFKREGVDAVFSPHCNFGTEYAVAKLAKAIDKPFLLWGPRDEAPLADGLRLRDSQCGLFATSKILRRLGVPFSYIPNTRVDDPIFERGLKNFLAAAAVIKAFRNLRVGQISTRPDAFWSVIVNEGELLERFGIQVVPVSLVDIVELTKARLNKRDDEVEHAFQDMKIKAVHSGIADEYIRRMAALKVTLKEWARETGCSALAVQCWTALQQALGIMPCFVHAELTDEGLPVACETDIHGAITAVLVQAARRGESPIFFADVTIRHPENDNAELLWHCGPFPLSLKVDHTVAKIGYHYVLESHCPGVAEWEIRGGDVTLARFDGDNGEYYLLMGQARGTTGPKTRGTYLWVEVNDWSRWEEKLIRGPYIHHIVGVHGQIAPVLYEACRYIPSLTADPIEPSEDDICAYLRGR